MSLKFFTRKDMSAAHAHVSEQMNLKGADVLARRGLLVDGQLHECVVRTGDASPIYISALASLEHCTIEAQDLLIEGRVHGATLVVHGKLELAAGAVVIGTLYRSETTEIYVHPQADIEEFVIKKLPSQMDDTEAVAAAQPALASAS